MSCCTQSTVTSCLHHDNRHYWRQPRHYRFGEPASVPFCCGAFVRRTLAVAMFNGERAPDVVRSARRRRERRLRCFLRHEEMAVRMALARATHHAVQRHQCTQTVTPAATDAATPAPLPVIECMVSAPAVNNAAPALLIEYVSSAPRIEYIAPAGCDSFCAQSAVTFLPTPRQPTLLTTTSTLPIWCTRNFPFLLLRLFRHWSLVHFLQMNLMRPCTTKSIRNRSLQG